MISALDFFHAPTASLGNISTLISGNDQIFLEKMLDNLLRNMIIKRCCTVIISNIEQTADNLAQKGYVVDDLLSGEFCLCSDVFAVDSVQAIGRLRELLTALGMENSTIAKVISYLQFVDYIEIMSGSGRVSPEALFKYSSYTSVVKRITEITQDEISREQLLSQYSEVAPAAAALTMELPLLLPLLHGEKKILGSSRA